MTARHDSGQPSLRRVIKVGTSLLRGSPDNAAAMP
jgi:hypothetical protein